MVNTAGRTLQRRFRARVLYRQRRDRKLRDEWLGRGFELTLKDELTGLSYQVYVQVKSYNPKTSMVVMYARAGRSEGTIAWDTDRFWSMLRTGQLKEA